MASSPQKKFCMDTLKSSLKFIIVGMLFVATISLGFAIAATILIAFIIAIPIMGLWKAYKNKDTNNNTGKKEYGMDDFIEVEYEVIEEKDKREK